MISELLKLYRMKGYYLSAALILTGFFASSQSLDRISVSSGGKATDEVNFVIGETFCFSVASEGNIILEAGTLAGTENTGGLTHNRYIKPAAEPKKISFYPNPSKDVVYFTINNKEAENLIISIYDLSGKQITTILTQNNEIVMLDLKSIIQGSYITKVADEAGGLIGTFQFIKQ